MSRAATHFGTCQACGRQQKLPGGYMAKHGYELSHGFMNDVCMGAGHLPFEVSCDLVEETIAQALRSNQHDREIAANVRARPASAGDLLTYHQVYHPELSSRTRGSVRLWEQVVLEERDGRVKFARPAFENQKWEALHRVGEIAEIAADLRHQYADAVDTRIKGRLEYVEQQRARLVGWAPAPLTPIKPECEAA